MRLLSDLLLGKGPYTQPAPSEIVRRLAESDPEFEAFWATWQPHMLTQEAVDKMVKALSPDDFKIPSKLVIDSMAEIDHEPCDYAQMIPETMIACKGSFMAEDFRLKQPRRLLLEVHPDYFAAYWMCKEETLKRTFRQLVEQEYLSQRKSYFKPDTANVWLIEDERLDQVIHMAHFRKKSLDGGLLPIILSEKENEAINRLPVDYAEELFKAIAMRETLLAIAHLPTDVERGLPNEYPSNHIEFKFNDPMNGFRFSRRGDVDRLRDGLMARAMEHAVRVDTNRGDEFRHRPILIVDGPAERLDMSKFDMESVQLQDVSAYAPPHALPPHRTIHHRRKGKDRRW